MIPPPGADLVPGAPPVGEGRLRHRALLNMCYRAGTGSTRTSTRQALTWCCFVLLLQQKPVGNAAKPRPSCSSRSSIPAGVEGGSTSGKPPPTSRGFFGPITDDDSTTQQQYSLTPSLPSAEGALCGRLLWQFSLDVGRCAGRLRPYLES